MGEAGGAEGVGKRSRWSKADQDQTHLNRRPLLCPEAASLATRSNRDVAWQTERSTASSLARLGAALPRAPRRGFYHLGGGPLAALRCMPADARFTPASK